MKTVLGEGVVVVSATVNFSLLPNYTVLIGVGTEEFTVYLEDLRKAVEALKICERGD